MNRNRNHNQETSETELYTQRSMESLSSPDQLKKYLKVTGTPVWIVLIAILVMLVGLFGWSAFATLTSYTTAEGIVKDGAMTVVLQEDMVPKGTDSEMTCRIGDVQTVLSISGTDAQGNRIAVGKTDLPEGTYDVRVGYRQIKAIELLMN